MAIKELPPLRGRVLVIAYSAFGDIVQKMAGVKALKKCYPDLSVTWLSCSPYKQLVEVQPFVNDVLSWDRSLGNRGFLKLLNNIRKRHFDVVLDLKGTDRSLLMTLFSQAPVCIGWHARIPFFHNYFTYDPWSFLNIDVHREKGPHIFIPDELKETIRKQFKFDKAPLIVCVVGASKPEKCWPIGHWVRFLDMLAGYDANICIIGHGTKEERLSEQLCQETRNNKVCNATGQLSFLEMGAMIARASLVIGGDTGPSHFAEELGVPLIGLFGPTEPHEAGYKNIVALLAECTHVGCQNWRCSFPCMETITPQKVLNATLSLLA